MVLKFFGYIIYMEKIYIDKIKIIENLNQYLNFFIKILNKNVHIKM